MKNNDYRYCPYIKYQINRLKCCGCLFAGLTGNTNLFKIKCYFKYYSKKCKKELYNEKSKIK